MSTSDNSPTAAVEYRVGYLNPKAIARYMRGGHSREQVLREQCTDSFCKHLPGYGTAAEAQAVADRLEPRGFFHVVERAKVEPITGGALSAEGLRRELDAEKYAEADAGFLSRRDCEESDAFARRVMGLD